MKNKKIYTVLFVFLLAVTICSLIRIPLKKANDNYINLSYKQPDELDIICKKRVGLCQSLPDPESTGILYYTLLNLNKTGVISGMDSYEYKPFEEDSYNLWKYVCENVSSDALEFIPDFFYDLEKDDPDIINKRLKNNDIDLLLTYGTHAGTEFFNDYNDVMIINYGSNDPVEAGFVKGIDYSGSDNLWAYIDTKRYYNQIKMFYDAVHFKKLGIIDYTDSFRSIFTPKSDIDELSKLLGYDYKIFNFYGVDDIFEVGDKSQYYDELLKIHEKIASECDAFYMIIGGWDYKDLQYLLKPFIDNGVPVFSQFGSIEVKNGALMSVGNVDFTDTGDFIASVVVRILCGEKPGEISQQHTEKVGIAINMGVAKKIGFKPDIQFILNCDEIYN